MASTHVPTKPLAVIENDEDELTIEGSTPPETIQSYAFEPLPPQDYFRLVKLLPGLPGARLEVEISVHNLEYDKYPPYWCLSYTWNPSPYDRLIVAGERVGWVPIINDNKGRWTDYVREKYDVRHPVWCDGKRLLISTNLRDSLRRLRDTSEPKLIWIDGLCINQEDHDERAKQVLLMPKIYHKASGIHFWIGEEDEHVQDALRLLEALSKAGDKYKWDQASFPEPFAIYDESTCKQVGVPPFPSGEWTALREFCSRPVFQRVWIIQELSCASKVRLICGSITNIDIEVIRYGFLFLHQSCWINLLEKYHFGDKMCSNSISCSLITDDIRAKWLEQRSDLRRFMVGTSRMFKSSDPKDRVFALLGLINDFAHRDSHDLYGGDTFRGRGRYIDKTPEMEIAGRAKEAEEAEADERFRRAVDLLQASENSLVEEIRSRFAGALSRVVDLLMDVSNRQCETNFRRFEFEADDTLQRQRARIDKYMARLKEFLMDTDARSESKEIFEMFDGLVDWIQDPIFFIGDPPYSYGGMDEYEREELILYLREGNKLLLALARVKPTRRFTAAEGWSDDNSGGDPDTRVPEAHTETETIDLSEHVLGSRHVAVQNPAPSSAQDDGPQPSTPVVIQDPNDRGNEVAVRNQPWLAEVSNITEGMAQVDIHSDAEDSEDNDNPDDTISDRRSDSNDFEEICFEAIKTLEDEGNIGGKGPRCEGSKEPFPYWSSLASHLTMPDYTLPLSTIYREFTLHQLEEDRNLDILSFIEDASVRLNPDLPSWVPDFSVPSTDINQHPLLEYMKASKEKPWQASGSAPIHDLAIKYFPDDPGTLRVYGKIVDTIARIDSDNPDLASYQRLSEWIEMIGPNSPAKDSKYRTGDKWRAALWFTILHYSFNPNMMRRKHLDHDHLLGNMVKCNEVQDVLAHMARTGLSQAEVLRMGGLDEKKFERWFQRMIEFVEDLEPVMFMRRFFVTEGLYFGLGSKSARVGDKVVVLLGGKVPYVVRAVEGEEGVYRFVGDAYVHGIMKGEAVEADDVVLELIKLR